VDVASQCNQQSSAAAGQQGNGVAAAGAPGLECLESTQLDQEGGVTASVCDATSAVGNAAGDLAGAGPSLLSKPVLSCSLTTQSSGDRLSDGGCSSGGRAG
jgi:hypothetical protein